MPEAVIVATARSPIGRAHKGSMTELRPDDLAATIVRAALDKVPELNPGDIDDFMLGCGLPGGEQGFNMAPSGRRPPRIRSAAGDDGHPLLRIVAPDLPHGISRDQGRRG